VGPATRRKRVTFDPVNWVKLFFTMLFVRHLFHVRRAPLLCNDSNLLANLVPRRRRALLCQPNILNGCDADEAAAEARGAETFSA
jgi:hypothetical protein